MCKEYCNDCAGYETVNGTCLGFCFIMKGASFYEETGESWVKCKKLGKQFIKVSICPNGCNQIAVCPPFWVTYAGLLGPVVHYVLV